MSQQDVARVMGISTSLISHWEKGTRNISQGNLMLLAQSIGVNIGYMLAIDAIRPKFELTKSQQSHLEKLCHTTKSQ